MFQENKKNSEPSRNKILTFNSKLFLDIELSKENINSEDNTEDSEDSIIKSPLIDLKAYLSNDLIEELEFPTYSKNNKINDSNVKFYGKGNFEIFSSQNLEENKIINNAIKNLKNKANLELNNNMKNFNNNSFEYNALIPLLNKGYKFIPQNLKINNIDVKNNANNYDDKNKLLNFNKNNKYLFKEIKKEDWYCIFCNNLNYSFRFKCNRCGASKESSKYAFKKMLEQQAYNLYNNNNNFIYTKK